MQTSRWGPPGWKFLHTIAHNYDPENPEHDPEAYRQFFGLLGKVLPCRFCRESWTQYYQELPIEPYLQQPGGLSYWLYLVHNKVNNKLRGQGLLQRNDPTFPQVCAIYNQWRADCSLKADRPPTCRLPDIKDQCHAHTHRGRRCSRRKCQASSALCTQHLEEKRRQRAVRK